MPPNRVGEPHSVIDLLVVRSFGMIKCNMTNVTDVPDIGPLLDLSTTASLLNTSPTTFGRWAKEGTLPRVVLHRGTRRVHRRFRHEDIARLATPRPQVASDD